ncbi:hypothetical protein XM25_00845 [Devosia sp. H5989]|nr:hypothetical protein XM25_00845 [Devosia sp. H5989]
MKKPIKIEGARPIIDLPSSATVWNLALFDGDVIAVSEDRGAFVIRDGRAEKIEIVKKEAAE